MNKLLLEGKCYRVIQEYIYIGTHSLWKRNFTQDANYEKQNILFSGRLIFGKLFV